MSLTVCDGEQEQIRRVIHMAHYTILASMRDGIRKKIQHIINKCHKNNVPCEFSISDVREQQVTNKNSKKTYLVEVCDIDVEAHFKYNGWKALGMVQRKEGIVQCYFDDESLINQYKNTDFHCDHCRKRVHRNSIVVLENESGERKIVGTSCVKEFTNGLDGNLIALFNEYTRFLSDRDSELAILLQGESNDAGESHDFYDNPSVRRSYHVAAVLSTAIHVIDKYGWEPASSMNATWKMVYDYIDDNVKIEDEAIKAIEWVKSLKDGEFGGSYLFNMRQVIDAEYCSAIFFSLLVSLIPTFRKHERNRLLNEQREANKKVSDYIGNVGDKISETVTYITSYSYQSRFGYGYFHIFRDDNGNVIKWSTGNGVGANKGDKVILSGKIKDHEEFRGEKQTVLTRCKVTKLVEVKSLCDQGNNSMDCLDELLNG